LGSRRVLLARAPSSATLWLIMKIHKIEAAQRQLDTAIDLFFSEGDPCAVIALAAASEEVLGNYVDGVWLRGNKDNMFCRMYSDAISRGLEFKNETQFSQKLMNVTKNCLKHASTEEEQYVSFNAEEMVIRVMLALMNFQIGAGRPFSLPMTKFEAWLKENRAHYLGPKK
jgi:hypothetical protein